MGPSPKAFTPSGRLGSSPGAWGAPNKGNADGAVGILGKPRRVWATALHMDPPKKALCHTFPLGGACIKYCCSCVNTALLQLLGYTSAGRACCCTDLAIFCHAGRVWPPSLRPDPSKKVLCYTCLFSGARNKCRSSCSKHLNVFVYVEPRKPSSEIWIHLCGIS